MMILVLAAEIVFIIFMNTARCANYPEMDMAKLYRHAIEMVNNRSYFIDGWNYITTMELDCSLLFAVPIYALSGNIYLSFGIANIIFLFLYLFVIFDILKKLDVNRLYGYVAVIVFLIPYRIGMLEYFNMLFYNGGQYVVKVLVPLLVIDLMLEDSAKRFGIKNIILLILMSFFMVLTSMSSGTYVLMSGIVPVILAYIINIILEGDIKSIVSRRSVVILFNLLSFLCGYVLCRVLKVSPNSEGIELVPPEKLLENIRVTIWGYFSVFVSGGYVNVVSKDGLFQLLRYGFAFLVIILIFYNIRNIFKMGERFSRQRYLMMPFLVTFIILCLTLCCFSDVYYPERYYFIGIVPLFLTIPYFLEWIEGMILNKFPGNRLIKPALFIATGSLTLVLLMSCILNVRDEIRRGYDGGYSQVQIVLEHARQQQISNVLWLYDLPDGEVARLFAPDIRSSVINFTDDGQPFLDPARDFYLAANDASYYPGANLLIDKAGSGNFDRLPDEIRSSYTQLEDVGEYNVYRSGSCVFD